MATYVSACGSSTMCDRTNRCDSVVFESILFIVTLVALLEQEDSRSLSTLMLILYRDGEAFPSGDLARPLIFCMTGMLYFVAVTCESVLPKLVYSVLKYSTQFVLPSHFCTSTICL